MRNYISIGIVGLALVASACSGVNQIAGPSGGGGIGSLEAKADEAPTGNPAISMPHDAPAEFDFDWQGEYDGSNRNSAYVDAKPVVNVTKYEVSIERFESTNVWNPLPSFFIHKPFAQVQLPDGRYRARMRSVLTATDNGNWTPYVNIARETPLSEASASLEDCEWEFDGGQFKLRRRGGLR